MFAWLRSPRQPRAMVAKTTFIIYRHGRPVGAVPAGSLWVKSRPIVRAHRQYFEREKAPT